MMCFLLTHILHFVIDHVGTKPHLPRWHHPRWWPQVPWPPNTPWHSRPRHPIAYTRWINPGGSQSHGDGNPNTRTSGFDDPEQLQAYRWEREIDERNRPYSDEELDAMFPPGFKVLPPPAGYIPIRTPARKLTATPTPIMGNTPQGFYTARR